MRLIKEIYHKFSYNQKAAWDKIAYSYLKKCRSILDVGCGEGRFLTLNPDKITGIDWNSLSAKKCALNGYNVVIGDIRNLPFKDKVFDGVHCSHVIEHFPPNEAHQILSEIDRVLHEGGGIRNSIPSFMEWFLL